MGVLNLWKILQSTSQLVNIVDDLKNKTLAVDLSIWICENSHITYHSSNSKPYLRNLFFRCRTLIENGCKLIFIREGDVISLKHDTMKKRNQNRFGENGCSQSQFSQPSRSQFSQSQSKPIKGRSRFDIIADECTELLKSMGITVIRSPCGEAEKACAFLNLIGRCDAVLTNDSDVFLYGARCVYRNFSCDKKSADVIEKYDIESIEKTLGYDREMLVVLALLLGCDYDAKGVPGCGKEMACKFLNELNELKLCRKNFDVFEILRKWSKSSSSNKAYSKTEEKLRKLALAHAASESVKFPNEDIINEFMSYSKVAQVILAEEKYLQIKWLRPHLEEFQLFNEKEQNWTVEYSAEKLVPLIILYEHLNSNPEERTIKPIEIIKTRRKDGLDYYEVKWSKLHSLEDNDLSDLNEYTTLEKIDLFKEKFPLQVTDYQAKIDEKKATRKNKKKVEKLNDCEKEDHYHGMDSLMELYEDLSLVEEKKFKEPVVEHKTKKKQVKTKKLNDNDYIPFSQPITLNLKTSYRLKDIIELSDDDDANSVYLKPSQTYHDKTIVSDSEDEIDKKSKQTTNKVDSNLETILKGFESIRIDKPNLDESYLPLSQRIKQKYNLKTNSIFN